MPPSRFYRIAALSLCAAVVCGPGSMTAVEAFETPEWAKPNWTDMGQDPSLATNRLPNYGPGARAGSQGAVQGQPNPGSGPDMSRGYGYRPPPPRRFSAQVPAMNAPEGLPPEEQVKPPQDWPTETHFYRPYPANPYRYAPTRRHDFTSASQQGWQPPSPSWLPRYGYRNYQPTGPGMPPGGTGMSPGVAAHGGEGVSMHRPESSQASQGYYPPGGRFSQGHAGPYAGQGYGAPQGQGDFGHGTPQGQMAHAPQYGPSGYGYPQGQQGYAPQGQMIYGPPQDHAMHGTLPAGRSGYGPPAGQMGYAPHYGHYNGQGNLPPQGQPVGPSGTPPLPSDPVTPVVVTEKANAVSTTGADKDPEPSVDAGKGQL
ncbi:MAG: hypothetical protein HQL53_03255 [Magnetococcales bacterium]|nr:hypothetical protein [Magnetococcales bacterium]